MLSYRIRVWAAFIGGSQRRVQDSETEDEGGARHRRFLIHHSFFSKINFRKKGSGIKCTVKSNHYTFYRNVLGIRLQTKSAVIYRHN